MGVRGFRIARRVDDPRQVVMDLEFADLRSAQTFRIALDGLWASPQAQAALDGAPTARIEEVTEAVVLVEVPAPATPT